MTSKQSGNNKYAMLEEAYMQKHLKELKEAITEAHGVMGDMKRERQELQALRDETKAILDKTVVAAELIVSEQIQDAVKKGITWYHETLHQAIDDATERVDKRFNTLADIMLGEDDPNKESLGALVRQWRAQGMRSQKKGTDQWLGR